MKPISVSFLNYDFIVQISSDNINLYKFVKFVGSQPADANKVVKLVSNRYIYNTLSFRVSVVSATFTSLSPVLRR